MSTTVVFTDAGGQFQNWTAPLGCTSIDVMVEGPGGHGAPSDPVQESPGGGGGQGGSAALMGYPVIADQDFSIMFFQSFTCVVRNGGSVCAYAGNDAGGATGGPGSVGTVSGWLAGTPSTQTGANGQNALGNGNGGNGGGSPGNHGTPTSPAGNGSFPRGGGGGAGLNGSAPGGNGAGGRVTIVWYGPIPQ